VTEIRRSRSGRERLSRMLVNFVVPFVRARG
jgi:hypothetical protein